MAKDATVAPAPINFRACLRDMVPSPSVLGSVSRGGLVVGASLPEEITKKSCSSVSITLSSFPQRLLMHRRANLTQGDPWRCLMADAPTLQYLAPLSLATRRAAAPQDPGPVRLHNNLARVTREPLGV